jgi:uncharacterized protein DUF1326
MRALISAVFFGLLLAAPALAESPGATGGSPAWSMNATAIEACSCPMFCQCYFQTKPAAHSMAGHEGHGEGEHFCRSNMAWKVNKGLYGKTKLDGAKFWLAMDLGDDFSDGTMKWCVVHFDPSVTKDQRDGILAGVNALFPVKWETPVQMGPDLPVEWSHTGDKAVAKLDGGKAGDMVLNGAAVNRNMSSPVVIKNLKYWGAPRHEGFVLMPNEVEAYKLGPNAFEFKGTNGFMITVDIASKDFAAAATSGGKSGM